MCDVGYPVPILVFLGLSVLDLGPMYATDRETSDRQADRRQTASSLNAPPIRGGGIINKQASVTAANGLRHCVLNDL